MSGKRGLCVWPPCPDAAQVSLSPPLTASPYQCSQSPDCDCPGGLPAPSLPPRVPTGVPASVHCISLAPFLAGTVRLPAHLTWELAALVSRVCTRLLPGTEIAAWGRQEGGLGPRGVDTPQARTSPLPGLHTLLPRALCRNRLPRPGGEAGTVRKEPVTQPSLAPHF